MKFEDDFPSLKRKLVRVMETEEGFQPVLVEDVDVYDDFEPLFTKDDIVEYCNDKAKSVTHEELREAINKSVRVIDKDSHWPERVIDIVKLEEELGI